MSASREKRQRKLQNSASDELNAKKKDEKDNSVKYKVATIVVVVALVLSVALFVYQGIVTPNLAALTIGGEKVYDHELNYYYINAYSNFLSSYGEYVSMFGLDTSVSLKSQIYYGGDGNETWHDYFLQTAEEAAQQIRMHADAAEREGVTLSADYEAAVQDEVQSVRDYCESNGYDIAAYLKSMYGNRMTVEEYERLVRRGYLASQYSNEKLAAMQDGITDAEVESYYAEHKQDFDFTTYRRYLVAADIADDATEDETETALSIARSTAERIAAASTSEAEFIAQVVAYQNEVNQRVAANSEPDEDGNLPTVVEYTSADAETDTLRSDITYGIFSTEVQASVDQAEWLFDNARSVGDVTTIDATNGTYVCFFLDRSRNNYNTVDVRHILIPFEAFDENGNAIEGDVSITGTADPTDAQKSAASDEAERILAEWKAGAATEESFGNFAALYSHDGNAAEGGIYEGIYKGQMVTTFNDWCFDSSRKPGDTGVVETPYGYHVIYFVGDNAPYWTVQVRNAKANNDYLEWQTAALENYKIVEKGGIGNVGINR